MKTFDSTKPITIYNNVWSWDVTDSTKFSGEKTIACPKCHTTDWTLGTDYVGGYPTGPNGAYRVGDSGAKEFVKCNKYGHKSYSGRK